MKMRAWMTLTAACLLGACGQSTDQYDTTSIIGPGGTASPSPRTSPSLSPTASPSPSPSPASSPLASPSPAATARFVTNDTAVQDYRCGFSPDGSQIVFERTPIPTNPNDPNYRLMLVNTTGGAVQPLLPGNFTQQSTRPNWTPATNRIAFTAQSNSTGTVWTCNPDGSGLLNIAPSEFRRVVDYPYFFPDGLTLAVVDYGNGHGLSDDTGIIRRVSTQSPFNVTNLSSLTQIKAGMPSVSPNGRYVAVAAQSQVNLPYNQDTNQIFVIDLQAPAGTPPVLFDAGQGRAPSWSPNGQTITFESNRATLNEPAPPPTASPTNAPFAIYSKPFPTGVPTQITDKSLNANHCVWSRDGRLLVMSAVLPGNSRGIYVMPAP